MIEIREVNTSRERRRFLEFPNKLYRGCPYYVPPLYLDEKKIFSRNYVYNDTCEAVYYNAYRDGKMVGRISGILQRSSNEKWGQKRVRFTRFDVEEDFEAARELFAAVEKWALSLGMEEVVGPLGFSDLEREGLLIEGFDQMSTFEEAYNYEYYGKFIDKLGYGKEVDWLESQVRAPRDPEALAEMRKMSDFVLRRYKLHVGRATSGADFLKKYSSDVFKVLDDSYEKIYGTVPFTQRMKKNMIDNFRLIVDEKHAVIILDEEEKPVAFGVCFPCIAKPMQVSGGHLTPRAIFKFLRLRRHPEVIDLGLIGVEPEYLNRGISAVIANGLADMLLEPGIKYADTNLNLENNSAILNLWKRFDTTQDKRRRSYVKKLV